MTLFLRVNILGKERHRSKRLFSTSSVFISNNPCQPCSVKMRLSFSDWFIHLSRKRPAKLIVYMTWALSFPNISPVFHFSFLVKRILETTHLEHAYYPEEASAQVFFRRCRVPRFSLQERRVKTGQELTRIRPTLDITNKEEENIELTAYSGHNLWVEVSSFKYKTFVI